MQPNIQNKVASSARQGSVNLPTARPIDSVLSQAAVPNIVSQNCELQDVCGNLQKAENLLRQRASSGNCGNYQRYALVGECSTQVITGQDQEESLNFQQDSYLKLEQSTQSVLRTHPQTAVRQQLQQQPQQAPSILQDLLTTSEQPPLPSWQQEQLKEQKLSASNIRQRQLIGQQNSVPDLKQQRHHELSCQHSDFQSSQSRYLTPEQQSMSQSQPAKSQHMLNLSWQGKQQTFQTSGTFLHPKHIIKLRNKYLVGIHVMHMETNGMSGLHNQKYYISHGNNYNAIKFEDNNYLLGATLTVPQYLTKYYFNYVIAFFIIYCPILVLELAPIHFLTF